MIEKLKRGLKVKDSIILDGNKERNLSVFISHAHEDHLPSRKTSALTSMITKDVANLRKERELISLDESLRDVEMHHAGHVPGAKMISFYIDDRKYLYTGDFSVNSTPLLDGAKPVKADILIIDGTYISSEYLFPKQKQVIKELIDIMEDNHKKINYIFAYSFGKAQTIAAWLDKYGIDYYVDESIFKINKVLERYGYEFKGKNIGDIRFMQRFLEESSIVILPFNKRHYVNGKSIKIGVSGWAIQPWFKAQMRLDYALPISDHADHDELLRFIEKIDPLIVFGFQTDKEVFEETIRKELGIYAVGL